MPSKKTEPLKYSEHLPHSSLRDYVKCFWVLEREYTPEDPCETVTPDAYIELIFNFGAPYVLQNDGMPDREMPEAFLVGLQRKPLVFRSRSLVRIISIRFYAWGALPFLNTKIPGDEVPAIAVGLEWSELAKKIRQKAQDGDYVSAIRDVEDFLIGKLLAAEFDLRHIRAAAERLYSERGQFRVAELADSCNLSQRQLERRFQDVLGISPKMLARAIRFEAIRKRLMFEPDINLTNLAYEFAYSDQAHFIRDFKAFADRTPGEFAEEMRMLQEVFRDNENVVFLQIPTGKAS